MKKRCVCGGGGGSEKGSVSPVRVVLEAPLSVVDNRDGLLQRPSQLVSSAVSPRSTPCAYFFHHTDPYPSTALHTEESVNKVTYSMPEATIPTLISEGRCRRKEHDVVIGSSLHRSCRLLENTLGRASCQLWNRIGSAAERWPSIPRTRPLSSLTSVPYFLSPVFFTMLLAVQPFPKEIRPVASKSSEGAMIPCTLCHSVPTTVSACRLVSWV